MTLEQLMQVSAEGRDTKWEDQFLQAFASANVTLLSPDPQTGPDNWPYLLVQTSGAAGEPSQKILEWLGTRGIGLAVNPQKEYPDFVLSYGMIWNFRETGKFIQRGLEERPESATKINLDRLAHAGTPSPQYLPTYVRQVVREFFRDQGILNARILVMSEDRKNYDLAFSLESLGNPPESEWAGVGEALSWFLPPHYSILLVSEKGLPEFSQL
ncbi:MAG: hypothetical protein ACK5P7_00670 [Bdellovibrio sp.]